MTEDEQIGRAFAQRGIQPSDLQGAQLPTPKPAAATKKAHRDPVKAALAVFDKAIAAEREADAARRRGDISPEEYELLKSKMALAKRRYINQCELAAKNAPQPVKKVVDPGKLAEEKLTAKKAAREELELLLDAKLSRLSSYRLEKDTTRDEIRWGELEIAIRGLIGKILPDLQRDIAKAREAEKDAEMNAPKKQPVQTELQKKEQAWRDSQRI